VALPVRPVGRACALAFTLGLPACSLLLQGDLVVVLCDAEGAFGPPACPEAETCVEGQCRNVGLPLGSSCTANDECRVPATCVDVGEVLGLEADRRCTVPCCSAADCGPSTYGLVCRPLELAAQSLCWPAADVPGAVSPGDGQPGALCKASSECRSGACEMGRCLDLCCKSSDCSSGGQACKLGPFPFGAESTWACGTPTEEASDEASAPCLLESDCRSGSCSLVIDGQRFCADPCCSSEDCGVTRSPAIAGAEYVLACSKLNGQRTCARVVPSTAVRRVGEVCEADEDCRSGPASRTPKATATAPISAATT